MKKSTVVILVFAIALFALIGWRMSTKAAAKTQLAASAKAQFSAPPSVAVATATPGTIKDQIQALGNVVSPNVVNMSSRITGLITMLQVRPGAHIHAGQVIIQIDPSQITGLVYQDEANLAAAKSKLAQAKLTQNANDVSSNSTVQQDEAALASAKAEDAQAKQSYNATLAQAQAQIADAKAKQNASVAVEKGSEAGVASAKANLFDAQTKYNRTYSLYKQNFIAAQDVDDAKTAVAVANGAVLVAEGNQSSAEANVASAKAAVDVAEKQYTITLETAKAGLTTAKTKVTQAQNQLSVAKANLSQNPAYAENLNALRSAVIAAQGTLDQAKAQLAETSISSPIDGVVTARNYDPGSVVTAGQTILVVQSLNSVFVNAYIPIEKSNEVYTGQIAQITIDGIPRKQFFGRIVHISPAADQTTRQFLIQIAIPNQKELIKPGMFGHVTINASTANAPVTIPREALQTDSKKNSYVYVIDQQNKVHQTPVTVGMSNASTYQILSGLNAGQKVVILTFNALKDGEKVKPVKGSNKL